MDAKQTPLIELLERVPQDARVVVEHDQFSSSSHPVGRLCRDAASELRRLHAENEALRTERDSLQIEVLNLKGDLAELVEALRRIAGRCDAEPMYKIARAALAKVEASK